MLTADYGGVKHDVGVSVNTIPAVSSGGVSRHNNQRGELLTQLMRGRGRRMVRGEEEWAENGEGEWEKRRMLKRSKVLRGGR